MTAFAHETTTSLTTWSCACSRYGVFITSAEREAFAGCPADPDKFARAAQADAEAEARAFAAQYDTANVRLAISYAEQGRITWAQVRALFRRTLAAALTEVQA